MAVITLPYEAIAYTSQQWRDIWQDLFNGVTASTECVLSNVGNELAVSGSASPLSVATGTAAILGTIIRNTTALNVTVATPAATTGGHIIVETDITNKVGSIKSVLNTSGVNTAPALTQSNVLWQVRLATFSITNTGVITLTDTRGFLHYSTKIKGSQLDSTTVDNVTIENVGGLRVKDNSITTAKIVNLSVTDVKIADNSVNTAKIVNDAVDNTKVGNRVPYLANRQGGDATNWQTPGTSNYTPGMVRIQSGVMTSGPTNSTQVTFPVAFGAIPLVTATIASSGLTAYTVMIATVSISTVNIAVVNASGSVVSGVNVNWLAVGTE